MEGSHNEICRLRRSGSQGECPFRGILFTSGRKCVRVLVIVYRLHLQAITHYRSNYPDVAMWAGVRSRPIIKVVTNTSDSIKSKLIVIKRNGVSAGELYTLSRSKVLHGDN